MAVVTLREKNTVNWKLLELCHLKQCYQVWLDGLNILEGELRYLR